MKIFGEWWNLREEEGDGTEGAAAGSETPADQPGSDGNRGGQSPDGAPADADAGTGEGAGAGDKAKLGEPKDMLDAITKGLEKTAHKVEDKPAKKPENDAAAAAAKAAADKHPNGTPKKNEKGEALDPAGKVVPKQAKTAAELDLKPEELKTLGPKAQARFQEVISTLKERETAIAQLTESNKTLGEARDSIVSVLEETHTTPDQLSAYLEFNRMLQSNDPKEVEHALEIVERQRAALYKVLGREPAGGDLDLLAEFKDLQDDVSESRITRERALEIANARRERAVNERRGEQQRTQQQTAEQRKQVSEKAVKDIETWTAGLAAKDIDFKDKEKALLEQVDEVFKTYAPEKWLDTLKLLYRGIKVTKQAASQPGNGNQPIRPSGAKGGTKAPQNMFEAMWGAEAPK